MSDDQNLGAWNIRTAEHLRKVAESVASAPPPTLLGPVTIAFKGLEAEAAAAIATLVDALGGERDRCVYTIEAAPDVDIAALRQAFVTAQADNKRRRSEDRKHPDAYKLPQDNLHTSSRGLRWLGRSCARDCTGGRGLAVERAEAALRPPRVAQLITIALADVDVAAFEIMLGRHAAGEAAADCEPSGYRIVVTVDAINGAVAELELGSQTVSLGIATIA